MTDEKTVDAGEFTGKSVYYSNLAEAEEDVKKLTLLEDQRVKDLTEEEINRLYSGG
jgi:ribosomal protein S13